MVVSKYYCTFFLWFNITLLVPVFNYFETPNVRHLWGIRRNVYSIFLKNLIQQNPGYTCRDVEFYVTRLWCCGGTWSKWMLCKGYFPKQCFKVITRRNWYVSTVILCQTLWKKSAWFCIKICGILNTCNFFSACDCTWFHTNTFFWWSMSDIRLTMGFWLCPDSTCHITAIRFNQYKPCCTVIVYIMHNNFVMVTLVWIGLWVELKGSRRRVSHNIS